MTPHRLLLQHLHPYRTKLRHLQERIPRSCEGPRSLATIPHLDQETLHHQNRPQELDILEGPKEVDGKDSMMAQEAVRLQL